MLVSRVARRIQLIVVSSCEEDTEYFFTQKYHSKHGVHIINWYINFSPTMNFIYNYIIYLYYINQVITYIKLLNT